MIIVQLNIVMNSSDYYDLYTKLLDQVRKGVVLLPRECELVACADDTDLKVVKNDQTRD